MSALSIPKPSRPAVIYPDSDGKPIAENTLQFEWIVTIKEGMERVFHDRADVFVAGDLLWYPVEGKPEICTAPDTLIVFGRPKGYRGSYIQFQESGIAPQVVFEVLSPGNRTPRMIEKFRFYEKHGIDEYYIYDPDEIELTGYERDGGELKEIKPIDGWTSPRLGVRFEISKTEFKLFGPDGRRFLTYQEMADERDRLADANDRLTDANDRLVGERDQLASERDADRHRADRLAAQLRAIGIEPEA